MVFCYNQFDDGGVRKLFRVEGLSLIWENDKWLNKGNVV
jgi:hypothetical protein